MITVTKQTIQSLLVLTIAVAAQAGSGNSVERSADSTSASTSAISTALHNFSANAFKEVKGSVIRSAHSTSDASVSLKDGSVYVIESTSTVAANSAHSTSEHVSSATTWALTTSGDLVKLSYNTSSKVLTASGNAIQWTFNQSGRAVRASVEFAGNSVDLALDSSGRIYELASGSLVVSVNGSQAVLHFVGDLGAASVKSAQVSAADLSAAMSYSLQASKSAFNSLNIVHATGNMYPKGPR